jgi:hypothetical protein
VLVAKEKTVFFLRGTRKPCIAKWPGSSNVCCGYCNPEEQHRKRLNGKGVQRAWRNLILFNRCGDNIWDANKKRWSPYLKLEDVNEQSNLEGKKNR